MVYPKTTPLPDEEPPTPLMSYTDNEDGGDTVPDHGLVGEYSEGVRHQNENGGASYRLKHLRSAPEQETGFTSGQGRLYAPAVPYSDQRVGEATFNGLPVGPSQGTEAYGRYSNAVAAQRQVQAPPHPVHFPRGRDQSQAGNPMTEAPGATNANGRTLYGGTHRTDQRY